VNILIDDNEITCVEFNWFASGGWKFTIHPVMYDLRNDDSLIHFRSNTLADICLRAVIKLSIWDYANDHILSEEEL
jgi:hypothetical protein